VPQGGVPDITTETGWANQSREASLLWPDTHGHQLEADCDLLPEEGIYIQQEKGEWK